MRQQQLMKVVALDTIRYARIAVSCKVLDHAGFSRKQLKVLVSTCYMCTNNLLQKRTFSKAIPKTIFRIQMHKDVPNKVMSYTASSLSE